MPSPIGHALAGIAVAWAADLVPGRRTWRTAPPTAPWHERAGNGLTLLCAGLAVAPDLDLLSLPFNVEGHRTFTHSLGAVLFVGLLAGAMAANARRRPIARLALMCAAAWGSHILLDWLGADMFSPRGLRALWPFSNGWYISDMDVFLQTRRREIFTWPIIVQNAMAIAQELAILLPIVVALWLVRVKALAGLAAEVSRGDHAPQ